MGSERLGLCLCGDGRDSIAGILARLLVESEAQITVKAGDAVPGQRADDAARFQTDQILIRDDGGLCLVSENPSYRHFRNFGETLGDIAQIFLQDADIFPLGTETEYGAGIEGDADIARGSILSMMPR